MPVAGTGPGPCAPGLTQCGSLCVDALRDANNCGSCGNACGAGSSCEAGLCTSACSPGFISCGIACINPDSNPEHCGFCANRCQDGQDCVKGACKCGEHHAVCAGACVDLLTNEAHCGHCGNPCVGLLECQNGACAPPKCSTIGFDTYEYALPGSVYLTTIELNGDQLTDLVVATDQDVVPFLNFGGGTFVQQSAIRVARDQEVLMTVAAGDVNGDGRQDLAVGEYYSGTIYVLFAEGDGKFGAKMEYPGVARPTSLAIADTNNDGFRDVIVHVAGLVSVYRNTGMGTLLDVDTYESGDADSIPASSLALGDFDQNASVPDLATIDSYGGTIAVLRADAGSYPTTEYYQVGQWPSGIVAGDYDGDGDDDILFSDTDSGLLRVLGNFGEGTFGEFGSYDTELGVTSLVLAQLDVFPGPEIAALNSALNTLTIFPGYGSPSPQELEVQTANSPWILTTGDLDGDSTSDLAFVSGGPYAGLSVLLTRCLVE
jgi:hypothetical protein